ncbi:hypothetical protein [Gilliamella apicola]|uniref:Uncharacterized protein n=1 Tax=Gilliamella apicola TaxID=1196095 RepID=A0A2V4EHH0_9GAMM|nr:hypothetical protein [Gilliamella apicola]PXZ04088.1 hypothetical protein DKK79_06865 [Gilliamella apicola]
MKTILASFFLAALFAFSIGIILLIWDVNIFQYVNLLKILLTILTIVVSGIILTLFWALFFNKSSSDYNKNLGNIALPKRK